MDENRTAARRMIIEDATRLEPGHLMTVTDQIFEMAFGIPSSAAGRFLGDPRPIMAADTEFNTVMRGFLLHKVPELGIYRIIRPR